MFANGYEVVGERGDSTEHSKVYHPLETIGHVLKSYYLQNRSLPESSQELIDWELERVKKWFEEGLLEDGQYESYDAFEAHFLASLISPVTGKLIEWNHADFSRGNGFVTIMNADPKALEMVTGRWLETLERQPIKGVKTGHEDIENTVFIYYRAYGESGILDDWWSAVQ